MTYDKRRSRKKYRVKFGNLFLAFGGFVLIAFIVIGLIKINAKGGMIRAKKEAELNAQITQTSHIQTTEKETVKETEIHTTDETTKAVTTTKQAVVSTTASGNTTEISPTSEPIKKFFGNSAFVGDSVMLGMSNYVDKKGSDFLGGPLFLVAGSFSAAHALEKVSSDSTHPLYKGQKRLIEDSVKESGVDKVFLFFGLNDIGIYGVDKTVEHYKTIIGRIKTKSPDVSVIVISTTYMLSSREGKLLNNTNIAKLNNQMKSVCAKNGYGYIDIAKHVGSEQNGLNEKYCSDGYLHENELAYNLWTQVLCQYAQRCL